MAFAPPAPYIALIAAPVPSKDATERGFGLPLFCEESFVPSGSDDMYFTRRGRRALAAMNASKDRGARLAHAQLAAAYDNLTSLGPPTVDREKNIGKARAVEAASDDALMKWANESRSK